MAPEGSGDGVMALGPEQNTMWFSRFLSPSGQETKRQGWAGHKTHPKTAARDLFPGVRSYLQDFQESLK